MATVRLIGLKGKKKKVTQPSNVCCIKTTQNLCQQDYFISSNALNIYAAACLLCSTTLHPSNVKLCDYCPQQGVRLSSEAGVSCSHPVLETISLRILTASSLLMFSKFTSFTWLTDKTCHYIKLHGFLTKMLICSSGEDSDVFMHLCFEHTIISAELSGLQIPANPDLL